MTIKGELLPFVSNFSFSPFGHSCDLRLWSFTGRAGCKCPTRFSAQALKTIPTRCCKGSEVCANFCGFISWLGCLFWWIMELHQNMHLWRILAALRLWYYGIEHSLAAESLPQRMRMYTWYAFWLSIIVERLPILKLWDRLLHLWSKLISGINTLYAKRATARPFRSSKFNGSTLIAPYFYISKGAWQCAGYDSSVRKWGRLPPFSSFLPASCMPDPDLFKEYLVCTHGGIICMNFSKGSEERLTVFNPLTKQWRELPPLKHRRNPVLMHLVLDAATQSYKVIVAGSARSGDEHLSHVTEEFDSRSCEWKQTGDLPGPDYALNEFQSGVYKDGMLYCIAFLDHEGGRGILRYNLNKGIWLKNWTYPIPYATKSSILQLVEIWGELFLFSEQDNGNKNIEHCVDRVEWSNDIEGGISCSLVNVIRRKVMGGKSLEVFPEYTCVPYCEHQLCLFNTVDHSGVVYDVRNQQQCGVVPAPPVIGFSGESFYSLNAMSFTIEPHVKCKV